MYLPLLTQFSLFLFLLCQTAVLPLCLWLFSLTLSLVWPFSLKHVSPHSFFIPTQTLQMEGIFLLMNTFVLIQEEFTYGEREHRSQTCSSVSFDKWVPLCSQLPDRDRRHFYHPKECLSSSFLPVPITPLLLGSIQMESFGYRTTEKGTRRPLLFRELEVILEVTDGARAHREEECERGRI